MVLHETKIPIEKAFDLAQERKRTKLSNSLFLSQQTEFDTFKELSASAYQSLVSRYIFFIELLNNPQFS